VASRAFSNPLSRAVLIVFYLLNNKHHSNITLPILHNICPANPTRHHGRKWTRRPSYTRGNILRTLQKAVHVQGVADERRPAPDQEW